MSAIRFLAADKLASWLAEVAASRQVLAPRQEGKAVVFRPLVAGETPSLARATVSPKAAVFPACETLVRHGSGLGNSRLLSCRPDFSALLCAGAGHPGLFRGDSVIVGFQIPDLFHHMGHVHTLHQGID